MLIALLLFPIIALPSLYIVIGPKKQLPVVFMSYISKHLMEQSPLDLILIHEVPSDPPIKESD
jgi:hypothetical protein